MVIWNGNTKCGASDIMNFYQSLPGTTHKVLSFDCQPMSSTSSIGSSSVLVSCLGSVKFDGQTQEQRFSQNFLLNKEGAVWKVTSDCFRYVDRL